jgi:hypothetical protein
VTVSDAKKQRGESDKPYCCYRRNNRLLIVRIKQISRAGILKILLPKQAFSLMKKISKPFVGATSQSRFFSPAG